MCPPSSSSTPAQPLMNMHPHHPHHHHHHHHNTNPNSIMKPEASSSAQQDGTTRDNEIKAKIISHPQYSALLSAYLDCQKASLSCTFNPFIFTTFYFNLSSSKLCTSIIKLLRLVLLLILLPRWRRSYVLFLLAAMILPLLPSLIQSLISSWSYLHLYVYMYVFFELILCFEYKLLMIWLQEAYCDMLGKYKDEISRPIQEAMDFLKRAESQLNSITNGTVSCIFSHGIYIYIHIYV